MKKPTFKNDIQVMPPICCMGCAVLLEPLGSNAIYIGGGLGLLLGIFLAFHNPKKT